MLCTEVLNCIVSAVLQGITESPKKGDKPDRAKSSMKAAKPETKKAAAETAASPKTESKLKKRGEIELESKLISM